MFSLIVEHALKTLSQPNILMMQKSVLKGKAKVEKKMKIKITKRS